MGGTEIAGALQAAHAAVQGTESADIFLVTDGEVAGWKYVVGQAKQSGHHIFTVGVGSAVSEAFVRGLATETGGECELVSPREGMADRVIRHFERMRAPRAKRVSHRPAAPLFSKSGRKAAIPFATSCRCRCRTCLNLQATSPPLPASQLPRG